VDGKEWGRGTFVKKMFQVIETMGMGDVGVKGSDINSRHDGVGRGGHREEPYDLKEIVGIRDT
jgi:hypothetical protein